MSNTSQHSVHIICFFSHFSSEVRQTLKIPTICYSSQLIVGFLCARCALMTQNKSALFSGFYAMLETMRCTSSVTGGLLSALFVNDASQFAAAAAWISISFFTNCCLEKICCYYIVSQD